jgi:hypothetical protein
MVTAAYHILNDETTYHDLGSDHFEGAPKPRSLGGLFGALNNSVCLSRSSLLRDSDSVSF